MRTKTTLMSTHEDQRFIDALLNNDREVIDELYQKMHKPVISMILKNGGLKSDAKDIFQDAVVSLYELAQNDFKLTCPLMPFLLLICKRKWINLKRKRQKEFSGNFEDVSMAISSDVDAEILFKKYELLERNKLVHEYIEKLGPSCQQLIKLSWSKNSEGKYMKWPEIAEKLNLSYAYTRKKAAECKARLIELIKKDPRYKDLI